MSIFVKGNSLFAIYFEYSGLFTFSDKCIDINSSKTQKSEQ